MNYCLNLGLKYLTPGLHPLHQRPHAQLGRDGQGKDIAMVGPLAWGRYSSLRAITLSTSFLASQRWKRASDWSRRLLLR